MIPVLVRHEVQDKHKIFLQEGFWYHRAEPSYLMLVYWIPETASTIPANASHRVGIGAIVWNDKREVLSYIFQFP